MNSVDRLAAWLAAQGGAAHSTVARAAGFTTHTMRTAVNTGAVRRVRRSWLVAPSCDAELVRAVASGGRLTCVSAAARAGLWTPVHTETHVAVPATASRLDAEGMRLHWANGPAPVGTGAVVDPVVNVLFHAARCLPPIDALSVWESAIRTRHADAAVLARIRWRSEAAQSIADLASQLSDSGLETRFLVLVRSLGVAVAQQVLLDGHRVDAVIGGRLVVQLDGFAHHQAADRRRDLKADARLVLRGYTVLRFDYQQVFCAPEYVLTTIAAAIAQGLHA